MSGARWLWRACVPDSSRLDAMPPSASPWSTHGGTQSWSAPWTLWRGRVFSAVPGPGSSVGTGGRTDSSVCLVLSGGLALFCAHSGNFVPVKSHSSPGQGLATVFASRSVSVLSQCHVVDGLWFGSDFCPLICLFVLFRESRSGLLTCCIETPTVWVASTLIGQTCLTPPQSCLPAMPWSHGRSGLHCPLCHQVSCACCRPRAPECAQASCSARSLGSVGSASACVPRSRPCGSAPRPVSPLRPLKIEGP